MAYTIRDLVNDAYRESGVVGIGMTMTADQLEDGVSSLNLILDDIFARNAIHTTITYPVTFNGQYDYTIGQTPIDPLATPPDIIVPNNPVMIDQIIVYANGVRCPVLPMDPISYSNKSLDYISNSIPKLFWFERTYPYGKIRFFEGTPSGRGELVYKAALVDVTANTDYSTFPRALKPFLVYQLAYKIAGNNAFDDQSLKMQANNAWNSYVLSTYQGQSYACDRSSPNNGESGKYNIYAGN